MGCSSMGGFCWVRSHLWFMPWIGPLCFCLTFIALFRVFLGSMMEWLFCRLEYLLMHVLTFNIPHEQLNFLKWNPGLNQLIWYNMPQAILIDIALFFPGLLSELIGLTLGEINAQLPITVTQIVTDAILVTLLALWGYCTVCSLLDIEPNKVPFLL